MGREVEEIKSRIDIVDLLGGYIKLTPAGTNLKARCPFHNEKTPSFMVNPAKQIWRCFGCGEGGDIFTFLMKIEGLEFSEALHTLAQKAGIKLQGFDPKEESQKSRLYHICEWAAKYWQKILMDSSQAEPVREYLKTRGLSPESVEDFKIGYAVDAWDDLINFLKKKGFNEQEIFLAGLVVKKTTGTGFYDRFRGRLMFPIVDLAGRVIGFGGRALKKDETAKYINTPQSSIYNKSLTLYGLYYAKDTIKKNDLCVLVEGYMDTIPSHQAGVKNVAAISGTALTLEQIKTLKRYSNNLALALDMDTAGQMAASRSIDLALEQEMNVSVITLPYGKDPGECIQHNPADWPIAIKAAKPVMEYFFEKATKEKDLKRPEIKKQIVKILLPQVMKLGSRVEQDHWFKQLGQRLEVSESVLREEASVFKIKPITYGRPKVAVKIKLPTDANLILFKRLLSLVFAAPLILPDVIDRLPVEYLENDVIIELYKALVLFYNKNISIFGKRSVDNSEEFDLFDSFNEWLKENKLINSNEAGSLLAEAFLLSQKDFSRLNSKEIRSEVDISLKILKDNYLHRRIDWLKSELAKAEGTQSAARVNEIYSELDELIKQKKN